MDLFASNFEVNGREPWREDRWLGFPNRVQVSGEDSPSHFRPKTAVLSSFLSHRARSIGWDVIGGHGNSSDKMVGLIHDETSAEGTVKIATRFARQRVKKEKGGASQERATEREREKGRRK